MRIMVFTPAASLLFCGTTAFYRTFAGGATVANIAVRSSPAAVGRSRDFGVKFATQWQMAEPKAAP